MRSFLVLALFPLLLACGTDDGGRADDPADSSTPPPRASQVPAAPGDVVTRNLITVMDTGDGPEACLGAVAESYPPQCGGPPIAGWDWKDHGRYAEKQGSTRWGEFALRGTWDGGTFTLVEAIPAALYDVKPVGEPSYPEPAVDHTDAELEQIAEEVGRTLPGAQGAYPDNNGHVLVDVTYDDGTLQDQVDQTYGDDVVVVSGQLVDA